MEDFIRQELAGRYFSLFDKDNYLFYPEGRLEDNLKQGFREVKEVEIFYDDFFSRKLRVEIKERKPKFLFCLKKDKCFFMEEDGYVFSKLPPEELKVKKNFIVFLTERDSKVPQFYLEEKEFTKLRTLIMDLYNLGLKIVKVVSLKNEEILLKTKSGASLVINLKGEVSKIPDILKKASLKDDLKIDYQKKDFKNRVDYVNLTFKNRIYYCMGGDVCQSNY